MDATKSETCCDDGACGKCEIARAQYNAHQRPVGTVTDGETVAMLSTRLAALVKAEGWEGGCVTMSIHVGESTHTAWFVQATRLTGSEGPSDHPCVHHADPFTALAEVADRIRARNFALGAA